MNIEIHDRDDSPDIQMILDGLVAFNQGQFGLPNRRELVVTIKNGTQMIAGLNGFSSWGWLYIKLVWVAGTKRSQGLGTRLLEASEAEAKTRGCHGIWLDTFNEAAKAFYERRGYSVFGQLRDFPEGHKRFFLFKSLK